METPKTWKYDISEEPFTMEGTTIAALILLAELLSKQGQRGPSCMVAMIQNMRENEEFQEFQNICKTWKMAV